MYMFGVGPQSWAVFGDICAFEAIEIETQLQCVLNNFIHNLLEELFAFSHILAMVLFLQLQVLFHHVKKQRCESFRVLFLNIFDFVHELVRGQVVNAWIEGSVWDQTLQNTNIYVGIVQESQLHFGELT